jgi:hypothetical protein
VKRDSLPWLQDIYWRILDGRTRDKTFTMITTNLTMDKLAQRLGERASSRLTGMMGADKSNFVDMTGVDDFRKRGKQ